MLQASGSMPARTRGSSSSLTTGRAALFLPVVVDSGELVNVAVRPSSFITQLGCAFATDNGATILLRSDVFAGVRAAESKCMRVLAHELAHVVLHIGDLRNERGPSAVRSARMEVEADHAADLACAMLKAAGGAS